MLLVSSYCLCRGGRYVQTRQPIWAPGRLVSMQVVYHEQGTVGRGDELMAGSLTWRLIGDRSA